MPRLLVSCGEPSGDLYAADLVRHLRRTESTLDVYGLGGDQLGAEGARLLAHVRELAVVGLWEVASHLPRFRRIFSDLLAETDRLRPDLAVLVDYPDFNLRLARALHRRGIPVVYYVSPQVWAWRPGRIRAIRDAVTHMIVIFPFKEEVYRAAGVPVTFVGHPLVDLVRLRGTAAASWPKSGSTRRGRRSRSCPAAAARRSPTTCRGSAAPWSSSRPAGGPAVRGRGRAVDRRRAGEGGLPAAVAIARGDPRRAGGGGRGDRRLGHRDRGGRAHRYADGGRLRLSGLTYALGRRFVRVPHVAMANLIAGRRVVPELIQGDFTPDAVAAEILRLLGPDGATMRAALGDVRARLGPGGASARAAGS